MAALTGRSQQDGGFKAFFFFCSGQSQPSLSVLFFYKLFSFDRLSVGLGGAGIQSRAAKAKAETSI